MAALPRISIITPSYNQAQFLEKTILSIINQNYPHLEFIIMDGGSTDGSVDIIKKYEQHISYWVSEKDNGQSDAINRGIARSTGEIVNWINSDDRLLPGALNSLVKAVQENPDMSAWVGACNLVDAEGGLIETNFPRGLVRDQMAEWGIVGHFFQPSCFLSRKVWDQFGPLDRNLYCCFDLDLYLKILKEGKFYGTDKIWTEATIHKDAKTQEKIPLMKAEICIVQCRNGYEQIAVKSIERAIDKAEQLESISARVVSKELEYAEASHQPSLLGKLFNFFSRQ